jgi:multicomponent Na+:H+ antiporter subunit G
MNEIIGYIFIAAGFLFDIFGCLGLVRLPDVYNRLQAAAKCITFGTVIILLGTIIIKGFTAAGIKAFLCVIFLIFTAPVAAHALARGAHIYGVKLWEKSVCDEYGEDRANSC